MTKNKTADAKKVIVLGAGMVGSVIAADLSTNFEVTSVDYYQERLEALSKQFNVNTRQEDLVSLTSYDDLLKEYDIVVNAVPGFMGFSTLKKIIEAGKNVVDISFFGEDAFELDALAKRKSVTAITDCGVAPGLSNIVLGHHYSKDKVKAFVCYVGGLPFERKLPYQYKVPFSPTDVIEEYTRPARFKENGIIVIKEALTEPELLNFRDIGTLEAFNSDGLRSLLKTLDIPDMKEKTLRYPGHLDAVKVLKDSGFFSSAEVEIKGNNVKPVDLASKILFDLWRLQETDDEFTVMRLEIVTEKNIYKYDLFDRKDKRTGFSSMSRTTGFTCTAAVNLLAADIFTRKGISPPEYIGMEEESFTYVMDYLKQRSVVLEHLVI